MENEALHKESSQKMETAEAVGNGALTKPKITTNRPRVDKRKNDEEINRYSMLTEKEMETEKEDDKEEKQEQNKKVKITPIIVREKSKWAELSTKLARLTRRPV